MTDSLPAPRYNVWQSIAVALGLGTRALEEVRALKSAPPAARFPAVKAWAEGVHYAGELVAWHGSTYQAARDTAREPPHDDWILIASGGTDGRDAPVGEVCGLYDPSRRYSHMDLVAHDGGEWRAKTDNPGPLPGDDWGLSAMRGRRGPAGERGEAGKPGRPGEPGPQIVQWVVEGYRVVPLLSDGTTGPVLDMRAFFELYNGEVR